MTSKHPSPEEFHNILATNPSSKFTPFSLTLANGATLTGISHIPTTNASSLGYPSRPLLVGIHGATCSAYTYDLSPAYTASTYSDLLSLPFVAFNRPNFLDSSGWLVDRSSPTPDKPQWKAEEGNSYFEEEGRWLHTYILPALWKEFAVPNGCTSIVTTSHSMSVPATIIAASLYSAQPSAERSYVWAGMTLSAFAEHRTEHCETVNSALQTDPHREPHELPLGQDGRIHIPPFKPEDQMDLMLGPKGLSDDALRPLVWKQNTPFLTEEVMGMVVFWPTAKQRYKAGVKIPVLCALGEYDFVWRGTREEVEAFASGFVNAPRLEGARVEGGAHALELSRVAAGWWLRVFGWAVEVAAGQAMDTEGKPAGYV